jgi:hypothetical protein
LKLGELRIFALSASFVLLINSSVIAVPGYFTPPVRSWGVKSELEKAAASIDTISRMHMYIHQPVYHVEEVFTWESFLNTGIELAEDLARLSIEVFPLEKCKDTHNPT